MTDGIALAVFPLFAASLTRRPSAVAMVSIAGSLPWLLVALFTGALLDRLDRWRMLLSAHCLRAVAAGVLAAAVLLNHCGLWTLYLGAFLLGVGETFVDIGTQAVVPSVVTSEELERANGRLVAAEIVGYQLGGPTLGALLFEVAHAVPFIMQVLLGTLAALAVLAPPSRRGGPARGRSGMLAEIRVGLGFLISQRVLRVMAVAVFLLNLSVAAWSSTFVLFALERLHVSGAGYGLLLGTGATGGIVGGLVCSGLARSLGTGAGMIAAIASMGLAQGLLALSTDAWLASAALFFLSAAITVWHVLTTSFRQKVVPEELLGRVNSAYRLLGQGVIPLGAFLGAALVDAAGLRAPLFIATPLTLALAAALFPALRNSSLRAAVVRQPDSPLVAAARD